MQYESLLNKKEYLHLIFFVAVIFVCYFFFDLERPSDRAQSILVICVIGALYVSQIDRFKFSQGKWAEEEDDTNYEIVGPFALVLVAIWVAFVDYKTPEVISKYTGLFILFTLMSAAAVTVEINDRAKTRLVSDTSVTLHKVIIWSFFAILYFIASAFFLRHGTWEWDLSTPYGIFGDAFR